MENVIENDIQCDNMDYFDIEQRNIKFIMENVTRQLTIYNEFNMDYQFLSYN